MQLIVKGVLRMFKKKKTIEGGPEEKQKK